LSVPRGVETRKHQFFQALINRFVALRFIRVFRVICGKNSFVFLTTDNTDFTKKIAGRVSHEALPIRPNMVLSN